MGYTENRSATYLSTRNPCIDFFFHVVPDTPPEQIKNRVEFAWKHDPLLTLKLTCNLRGVRGTGKSDKEGFYTSALWLHENHPKTLACNIKEIADFGYFKDMLEILYRLLEGPDVREIQKKEWQAKKYEYDSVDSVSYRIQRYLTRMKKYGNDSVSCPIKKKTLKKVRDEKSKFKRLEKNLAKERKGLERYIEDSNYKFLHDCISNFFVELLKLDMEFYKTGDLYKINLASKWCPNLDSSYDKATLMCESIARKIFKIGDYNEEYKDLDDVYYAYKVRERLRKEILVPLHKALELPEVYISANRWNELPYERVPSIAMNIYKKLFYKHDKERFEEYLKDVKSGKTSIAAGALLPHEIINSLNDLIAGPEVAELQWKKMVDGLDKKGKLKNCMAICDVSGSMKGTPMEVSIALGPLISELSVFWNRRNTKATPVPSNQEGVALVSGFSKNLVTLFLEEGGIMDPEAVMLQAISGDEYQKLVVFD